jgi:SNF2 family DNA or RNA helicase
MEIVDNKALRLKLRNPQQVLTTIPESRAIGPNEVLVKWDVPQVHRLRSMNIDVPSPIQRYNWPGKYKPFEHQKVTAEFLVNNPKAFCFSDMGTGKTASAIWAADFLMTRGIINRALILCPVSIMDAAWRADLFSFAMHRKVDIAHGSADKRRKVIASDAEFVIINFDGTKVVKDEIANGGFDLIIVDEASAYKTATTQRWKTLKSLIGPDTWLWMMTGTPAAQGPQDAYGLAKLVNPAGLPRTFAGYRDMVMYKVTQFKWEPKPNATDTVHQILQPAIRFAKEDCLDLPEMTYVDRHVELTPQQRAYYNKLRKQLLMQAAGETVTAANAAVAMNKLLQISCGAVYTDDGNTLEFDIKNRYSVLKEVVDESANKVIVFVPFQSSIEALSAKLNSDGVTAEIINGSVPAGKRTEIFKKFQTETHPQVLVVQPQAAAHGVTLTAADTIVWWSPTPSLEIYSQANARIHRSGQKNKCTVVKLGGSAVERKLYDMLDKKLDAQSKIIKLYEEILA